MSVERYLKARAAYAAQLDAVQKLGIEIIRIGTALNKQPLRFIFGNSGMGLPPEALMAGNSFSTNADRWPSPQQIMQRLAELHAGKSELEDAWRALEPHQIDGLKAPTDLLVGLQ